MCSRNIGGVWGWKDIFFVLETKGQKLWKVLQSWLLFFANCSSLLMFKVKLRTGTFQSFPLLLSNMMFWIELFRVTRLQDHCSNWPGSTIGTKSQCTYTVLSNTKSRKSNIDWALDTYSCMWYRLLDFIDNPSLSLSVRLWAAFKKKLQNTLM